MVIFGMADRSEHLIGRPGNRSAARRNMDEGAFLL
jgi:hypothetical protein